MNENSYLFIAAIQWTLLKSFFQPSPSLDPFPLMSSSIYFRSKDKKYLFFYFVNLTFIKLFVVYPFNNCYSATYFNFWSILYLLKLAIFKLAGIGWTCRGLGVKDLFCILILFFSFIASEKFIFYIWPIYFVNIILLF